MRLEDETRRRYPISPKSDAWQTNKMFQAKSSRHPDRVDDLMIRVVYDYLPAEVGAAELTSCVIPYTHSHAKIYTQDPNIPKIQKPKYVAQTKKQKDICKRLGRGTLNTCAKFEGLTSISQKRRGHWTLKEFGAISLNQPELPGIFSSSDKVQRVSIAKND